MSHLDDGFTLSVQRTGRLVPDVKRQPSETSELISSPALE